MSFKKAFDTGVVTVARRGCLEAHCASEGPCPWHRYMLGQTESGQTFPGVYPKQESKAVSMDHTVAELGLSLQPCLTREVLGDRQGSHAENCSSEWLGVRRVMGGTGDGWGPC